MPRSIPGHHLNLLALTGVCAVLVLAFGYQLFGHELPCPLCLLQRGCFIAVGIGFLCNVRFGVSPLHYTMVLIGAVLGATTAGRQVLLHIVPGTGTYGSPLWGMHLYTWSFIGFAAVIIFTALILPFGTRSEVAPAGSRIRPGRTVWALSQVVMVIFALLVAANFVSTLLECGFGPCADNPVAYQWLGG